VKKLASDDPASGWRASADLVESNDPKAIEYLIGAASDPDERVRVKAIDTLGQLKAKDAVPLFVQKLFLRDTDQATKARILAPLGKIGDDRATSRSSTLCRATSTGRSAERRLRARRDRRSARIPGLEKLAADDGRRGVRTLANDTARKIRERPAPVSSPGARDDRRGRAPRRP
jgi:HEAT repeat protein